MARAVWVLAGTGVVLGGLGAVGWHRQPGPFARTWPPAWVIVPSGGPLYSGVIPTDAVSAWSAFWWPAAVVLPLFGAGLGAVLAILVPRRRQALGGAVALVVLGLLVGLAGALAWHVDPGSGIGWVGGFEEEIDLVYPMIGLALGLLAAAAARYGGALTPSSAEEATGRA